MNELELKKEFDVLVSPEDIELFKQFDELEKRVKAKKSEMREGVLNFLKENNLLSDGYEQDGIRFTYVKPSVKKIVDTQLLKDEGLYEHFLKESKVDESVRISIKYED